jgi:hypothetical protein
MMKLRNKVNHITNKICLAWSIFTYDLVKASSMSPLISDKDHLSETLWVFEGSKYLSDVPTPLLT